MWYAYISVHVHMEVRGQPQMSLLEALCTSFEMITQWHGTQTDQTNWPWVPRLFLPLSPSTEVLSARHRGYHFHTASENWIQCYAYSASILSTELSPQPLGLLLSLLFETGSCSISWPWTQHVAEASLKLLILCLYLPSAGVTDTCHCVQVWLLISTLNCTDVSLSFVSDWSLVYS